MARDPVSVCPVGATLGEGPVWITGDATLWFVDIKQHRIHRFQPNGGALKSWEAPAQPGWILPADDRNLIVGLQTGLHRFDPADGSFALLDQPEAHRPGNRLNDATVGADGTLWFGSMDDAEEAPTGHYYRFRRGRTDVAPIDPVVITNGPAIAPDGTLYHVDTLSRRIWAVTPREDGTLGPSRPFVEIEEGAGYPDGPVVDAEGYVWIGLFGGWGVRRYAPDGRLVATVRFPVANVTKIAFGGADLRTAYATTARKGLDDTQLRDQPLAGNLFAFNPGVAGQPGQRIAITG